MRATWKEILLACGLIAGSTLVARGEGRSLSLEGEWAFRLDPGNEGIRDAWYRTELPGRIALPGTTDHAGCGEPETAVDKGRLLRDHRYIGPAWYQREVEIPASWKGNHVELVLERCLWETRVWVDGRAAGSQDSLTTPHLHELGPLEPGRRRLTIRVDNSPVVNIGTLCHSYTEETQSIWNGIVGRIVLRARGPVWIQSLQVFPEPKRSGVVARVTLGGSLREIDAAGRLLCRLRKADRAIGEAESRLPAPGGSLELDVELPAREAIETWDEFHPVLYMLEAELRVGAHRDVSRTSFGFRDIRRRGKNILINGRAVQLRGTLECCVFPRTGHPPTDAPAWRRIFRLLKSYGMNHMRFHSWCPPEAAFTAADVEGIYLQPETSLWIDAWMGSRPPFPKLFGRDPAVVRFIRAEVDRIIETYGNHPSFCMLSLGNELHLKSDYEELQRIIAGARRKDPRRLYAVCTARALTPSDDYYVSHASPGGPTRGLGRASTDWDFSKAVDSIDVPLISHETGQRPVFPDYEKLGRYSGPLKPRNLLVYRDALAGRGMLEQNRRFTEASERWAAIQYRHEIEAILRTRDYCGFQLLQLNDFTGQGEALVGLLDPFWEPKGSTAPQDFRRFCGPTVPLLAFSKFLWTEGETFRARALVSHFGPEDLRQAPLSWSIRDSRGTAVKTGSLGRHDLVTGRRIVCGDFQTPLDFAKRAERYVVSLEIGAEHRNEWNIWVFPDEVEDEGAGKNADVIVSRRYDQAARVALGEGKKVLLVPLDAKNKRVFPGNFFSVYWSAKFFPRKDGTLGWLCRADHPALARFPTQSHTDWQWQPVVEGSRVFVLNEAPVGYRPIVQPISDFHLNDRMGALFESRVGEGKLLVCGLNVWAESPAARQMLRSLVVYMASAEFAPRTELDGGLLARLFVEGPPPRSIAGEVLNVVAAADLKVLRRDAPWSSDKDRVLVADAGYSAELLRGGTWKDDTGSAWHGSPLEVAVRLPKGVSGKLHLHLHDWNRNGRTGVVEVDGREQALGDHTGEGRWLVFDIQRADTLDGKVRILCTPRSGPNLMISQIIFRPEDE